MTQGTAGAVDAIRHACIDHLAVALPTLLRKNRQATCTMWLIYNTLYIYIMEFFAKQPKLKCTMAGLLYREKIYEKMSVPPTATLLRFPGPPAACQQKSTAAWEEKHHGLICRTASVGTVLRLCQVSDPEECLLCLGFLPQFFWVQHIAGYQFLPPLYVVEADGTLEFGGLIIFEVLGISGLFRHTLTMTYIYIVEIKPNVQAFSKDTTNSNDQNETQFACVRALTLSMVSEAFSKARM